MGDVEDFLEHYGVKGQKWGVRRKSKRSSSSGVRGKTPGTRTYDVTKMSNKDLKRVIDRMRLEQEYARLNEPKKKSGNTFVKDTLKKEGTKLIISAAKTHGATLIGGALGTASAVALTRAVK